jgi:hypothetical protein
MAKCPPHAIGSRFGRLIVEQLLEERDAKKQRLYRCICDCGKYTTVTHSHLNQSTKSCGCLRAELAAARLKDPNFKRCDNRGEKSANWKGGRVKTGGGYIYIKSRGHPAANQEGYVLEHRLMMEKILGRLLLPNETVHHRNGDRADNRPENLELWSFSQPYGQRVEDKIRWAKEILALYEPTLDLAEMIYEEL